ncbi:outer membrane protein assembly factor BamE, partial [Alcaligenes pakistanensis]
TFQTGSYPNIDNLRQVREGVTRDQLYDLLGRPHFAEGFKVREWDYLFHFNTAQGIKTCQFKVLFDQDMLGRSFYWQPSE